MECNLIKAVEQERISRGLSHRELSQLLGIHESMWHRVRTGKTPPRAKFLTSVMRHLPGLALYVIDYLREK